MAKEKDSGQVRGRTRGKFESAPTPKKPLIPADVPKLKLPNLHSPLLRWIPAGLLALVLLVAAGCGIFIATDPYDMKILSGVSIGGFDVSGMNPLEAHSALTEASEAVLATDLPVELPEETIVLSAKEAKVSVKAWQAVWDAFRYGRKDDANTAALGLVPYLSWDDGYIRRSLQDYAAEYDTDFAPSQWTVEGEQPDLKDGQGQPQTLKLTLGMPTTRLDVENARNRILEVYNMAFAAANTDAFMARAYKVDTLQEAEIPELKEIYDELYIAPVDDSLDMTTYQPVAGSWGYGFDLKDGLKAVRNAEFGETLSIPMTLLEPEITGDEVYFRDVLGYCQTPHTKNENRNHNLTLACKAMDGLILQPGDVFSYNDTLGERTKERGYLRAGAYSGLDLVQSYGGGICQGSSTIYCAVLYADLEIVFRINHGYAVSYIDYGLDATVNWGGPDFQFRNNTNFPIKIAAEVSDGFVKVTILGTEERDYYVKMESEAGWGASTIYARSYKCKYDRETDELISRELEARSNYMRG